MMKHVKSMIAMLMVTVICLTSIFPVMAMGASVENDTIVETEEHFPEIEETINLDQNETIIPQEPDQALDDELIDNDIDDTTSYSNELSLDKEDESLNDSEQSFSTENDVEKEIVDNLNNQDSSEIREEIADSLNDQDSSEITEEPSSNSYESPDVTNEVSSDDNEVNADEQTEENEFEIVSNVEPESKSTNRLFGSVTTPMDGNRYTVLLLDSSGSMTGTPLMKEKEAANKFCDQMIKAEGVNYISIVTYSTDILKAYGFTDQISDLQTYISNMSAYNGTNTNAALK